MKYLISLALAASIIAALVYSQPEYDYYDTLTLHD